MQIFGKQVEEKTIDCDVNEDDNVYKIITEREKRTESLIKRIKRLQWKQLESHTMEQLESFYKRQKKPPVSNNSCQTSLPPPSPKPPLEQLPLSSSNPPAPSTNNDVINLLPTNPNNTLPSLPPDVNQLVNNFTPSILDCAEDELLRSAVGIITANLKHLEYSYDSDATESSSGGESCDEFENVFSETFHKPDNCSNIFEPIERKANNRWLNERSAIASRWTWLQAQVADLEFKIRQQNEMYRQLRASKGSIAFYCKEAPTTVNNTIPNCLNKSSSSITTTPKTSLTTSTATTSTTSIPKHTKPTIQIPPAPLLPSPSTGNPDPLRNSNSTTKTTTTTTTTTPTTTTPATITTTTSTIGTTTTTDALSVDVSSFNFDENSPPLSDCTNNKLLNILGSINEIPNTQTNLSTSSGPNSNGLSDYSLPSVNSDSTISLSPPLETMAPSTSRTTPSPSHTPPPQSSHRLPPSFEDCISTNQSTTSTSAPTTFSCTLTTTNATTTITTTTTATTTTCTTATSNSITPQKQSSPMMLKECNSTPTSEDRHDVNQLNSSTSNSEKEIHHCARTLPLKQMRKRKLVRSFNAITIASRKIARYSTVQCTCTNYPKFVSPCVLCNGRFSHLQMVDTDCMPNYERYALLDPSYHPVLSLPTDVALGLYFSKILKKDTTTTTSTPSTLSALSSFSTTKAAPTTTKSTNKSSSSRSAHSEFPFKFGPDIKKTQLNRGKSQAIISSTKLKKKYDGTTKKKYAKKNNNLRKRNFRTINDQSSSSSAFPSSGENSSSNSKIPIHRRRRSEPYAYDIDNIVIPYSIASTTRVEKLQYKEIITPKWRWVETDNKDMDNKDGINNNDDINQQSTINSVENNIFKFDHEADETDEDTSDEAFAIRHAKCEIDERRLRNLHLHQKTSKASSKLSSKSSSAASSSITTSTTPTPTTTTNHHSQSPPTEIISCSTTSLTQNSHAQIFP